MSKGEMVGKVEMSAELLEGVIGGWKMVYVDEQERNGRVEVVGEPSDLADTLGGIFHHEAETFLETTK